VADRPLAVDRMDDDCAEPMALRLKAGEVNVAVGRGGAKLGEFDSLS
jgi:hypothetical protein